MNNNHAAAGKPDQGAQHAATGATEHPEGGAAGKRHEVGDAESSRRHPPHVTENEDDAPIQASHPSPTEVPTLPANAVGGDRFSAEEQAQGIDGESMYDRRPAENKDTPPSSTAGQ